VEEASAGIAACLAANPATEPGRFHRSVIFPDFPRRPFSAP